MADDFRTTTVGTRYARALFDLARERGALEPVRADLRSLRKAWGESADLRRLAGSPVISAEDKARGLAAIAEKGRFHALTRQFLGLVAGNGRAGDLMAAVVAFDALYAAETGLVSAEVVSAAPLAATQLNAVKAALRQALGKDPELEARVDPGLLGGLKVKVGSRLFDASLRTRLNQLKFTLGRAGQA